MKKIEGQKTIYLMILIELKDFKYIII